MIIKKAEFICSSERLEQCPQNPICEYAFIGRSNVGKSSLINMLTRYGGLAKVSSTPGKTQHINHFLINDEWYLVDLPGYGYARVGHSKRQRFSKLIESYTLGRENLTMIFVLVDSRHEPQKNDMDFIRYLGENGVPMGLIFTKADKLSAKQLKERTDSYLDILSQEWEELPPYFITSSEKGVGRDEVLSYIDSCNKMIKNNK